MSDTPKKPEDPQNEGPAAGITPDPDATGVERDDAQADDTPAEQLTDGPASDTIGGAMETTPPGAGRTVEVRHGMFGQTGSGDTSGYGRLARTVEFPGAAQRPYGDGDTIWWDDVADRLEAQLPAGGLRAVVVHGGEITFHVEREHLAGLARHLRDEVHLRFEFCSSVSGVHYPADAGRELHVVYHLQSMTHNRRIRLEVTAPDADPHIPSVVPTYPTADWQEREAWDMFGVVFDGHPALTRVLMPDDWPGHPQRKDYPLGGIGVEYKGATIPPPDQRRSYN